MNVTEIRIDDFTPDEKIKATVTVVLDNVLCIHKLHVIDGRNGLFVAYPNTGDMKNYKNCKRFYDIVHPCNEDLRKSIENSILEKYEAILATQD